MAIEKEYAQIVRKLRPYMHRADVDALATLSGGAINANSLSVGAWTGKGNRPCSLQFDSQGKITSVTFPPGWPADVEVEGLRIGMSEGEVSSRFPNCEKPADLQLGLRNGLEKLLVGIDASDLNLVVVLTQGLVTAFSIETIAETSQKISERKRATENEKAREAAIEARKNSWKPAHRWKNAGDPDQMLRGWAANADSGKQQPRWTLLADWLIEKADIYDRHHFVSTWNWDNGILPIAWAALQPSTARATALHIFWAQGPDYYKNFVGFEYRMASYEEDSFELLGEVKSRLEADLYWKPESDQSSQLDILYVPPDYSTYVDMTNDANRAIYPLIAFTTIEGREIDRFTYKGSVCPIDYS